MTPEMFTADTFQTTTIRTIFLHSTSALRISIDIMKEVRWDISFQLGKLKFETFIEDILRP
jgi:hypothetical protein